MTPTLSIKDCLSFGWKTFKKRPWFFVGVVLIIVVVQSIVGMLQNTLPDVLGIILSLIVSTFLYAGTLNLFLKAHEDVGGPTFRDLWYPKPFWNYLGVSILLMIIVGIGLILLIVPGVILGLMLFAAGYLVVDRGMNPIQALKESARITKGNRLKLLLLLVVSVMLSIIGMLPLFLGLLLVIPVIALAGAHAYRTLAHQNAEVAVATS